MKVFRNIFIKKLINFKYLAILLENTNKCNLINILSLLNLIKIKKILRNIKFKILNEKYSIQIHSIFELRYLQNIVCLF